LIDIPENIYGHRKRLEWIMSHIRKTDTVLEVGCGTGYMITLQLARQGYNALGVDLDKASITYGQRLFESYGLDPERLICRDLADTPVQADVIIASEVLEHVTDTGMDRFLSAIQGNLKAGGLLLVTIPNGYGCFEIESLIFRFTKLQDFLSDTGIEKMLNIMKKKVFGFKPYEHPSTLSDSPHVQRFTWGSILKLLSRYNFKTTGIDGSAFISGPLSNLLFTGIKPAMLLSQWAGSLFPSIASGFFIACKKGQKT